MLDAQGASALQSEVSPYDLYQITAWSALATAGLLLIILVVGFMAGSRWMEMQRQQAEDVSRLRYELVELRRQQPAAALNSEADGSIHIQASTTVFQIGDQVRVTEGLHRDDTGTIVPAPIELKAGYVCVDLVREGGQRYVPVSRLAPLDGGSSS